MSDRTHAYYHGPVWNAFGLTRASYHVVPRRTLQSMPIEWQERYVALMQEMNEVLPDEAVDANWVVTLRIKGRFSHDPGVSYRHAGPWPLKEKSDE